MAQCTKQLIINELSRKTIGVQALHHILGDIGRDKITSILVYKQRLCKCEESDTMSVAVDLIQLSAT